MSDKTGYSIDDLLASLEAERVTDSKPNKVWSMDDIDALLVDDGESQASTVGDAPVEDSVDAIVDILGSKEEKSVEEQPPEPKKEAVSHKTKVFSAKAVKVRTVEPDDTELDDTEIGDTEIGDTEPEEIPEFTLEAPIEETSIIMELADEPKKEEPEVPHEEKRALAGKTVGIYPVRNESIDHQILTEKVEKSHAIETDKYRERFLNKPKQHIERTADYERLHPDGPEGPIERAGMIIKKSKFTNTADLEPIPTIISADAELNNFDKTIVAKGDSKTIAHEENDEFIDGQMRMSEFGEEEKIDQIDEESAEESLKEKRDKKIASFKLDADFAELPDEDKDDEDDGADKENGSRSLKDFTGNYLGDEFDYPSDANRIRAVISNAKRATTIRGIIQVALTIVSLVITGIISTADGSLEIFGGNPVVCGAVNIGLLFAASICGYDILIRGFNALKELKPNVATGTLLVVVACLLENIVIAFLTPGAHVSVSIFTATGCFALAMATLSKWLVLARMYGNFEFITNGTQLYSSEKIDDKDDAFEIGRGLLMGDPEVCYNAKVSHPKKFIENSLEDDPADAFAMKIVPAVAAVALLAAIIYGAIEKDVLVGFSVFAAVCGIAMPAFMLISSNIALFVTNRKFNRTGAAIIGHRAVKQSTDINAYVLDSTDIFRSGTCSIIGIKTFHNMRIDDAILYAAALVVESGGPLGDVFSSVILGKKELLPPLESLAYEERLGLSAWIHGRRVLVGSRDLLINHNVEAPSREFEMQYTHHGRKVIYLAIAGKIAAMFAIQYRPDKHMRRYLQNIDKAGVSLLVRSCDCNITEEMICNFFNLPTDAVKVISPVSGDIFQDYRMMSRDDAQAGILHNGTIEASLKTIYEAGELFANIPVNNIVSLAYTVIAVILFVILSLLSGPTGVTGTQIVLFQLLWGAVAAAIPVLKRKMDK